MKRARVGIALASIVTFGALIGCGKDSPNTRPQPVTLGLDTIATNLNFPVFVTAPPGDPTRFVILEKVGRVWMVQNDEILDTPFLDLRGQVSTGDEQGLLSIAFDPHYATNGRFYVSYTDLNEDLRLDRWRVSSDPNVALPSPERNLLTISELDGAHNAGTAAFGRDGMLYLSVGDGNGLTGGGGDQLGNGQDRTDLLGSILRLDVSGAGDYAIPANNPFSAPDRGELWNYGLRNPWRFSFDRVTGDLYIGDVGQASREEVDVATTASGLGRGANYGWSVMEGSLCFRPSDCDPTGITLPAIEYPHTDGCSVIGGYVYRGSAIPSLRGAYFYGDYCHRWVRSFRYVGGRAAGQTEYPELNPGGDLVSFGEDARGELYLCTQQGGVFRIVAR